ncbi:MAG TPA: isoprenylcysteine carboxylmethyltransferase family protein [Candidatus Omnitrophota bacterium]|nr:isoprenylcysteine carboxylmethyltransferase family protein [Candidatus Omnitrophota bacterium]
MEKIRFKKLRLWLVYPFFIIYPLVAHMTDISFLSGVILMAAGLILRFWASGYLTKSRILTTSGPYSYTRNPLYLGNFILGLGISTMASSLWLNIYYIVSFSFLYFGTIREEQVVLEEKFGEPYKKYIKSVPAFFPSIVPYKHAEKKAFDINQSFKNGEFIRLCGFTLLIIFFYLWRVYTLRKEGIYSDYRIAIALFVVFSLLLWFNISIRRRKEKEWTGANS